MQDEKAFAPDLVVRGAGRAAVVCEAHMAVYAEKGIISRYGVPQKIVFIEEMAKTIVGEVNKTERRERTGTAG